jgi:peptidoglycan/LPS O-acetylase OafA/YrhL
LHKLDVTYDYGFLRGIAGFALGMLVYDGLYTNSRCNNFFGEDMTGFIFIFLTLLFMHIGVNDFSLIPVFLGVTLCFACNSNNLHKLCNLKLPQFLGKISYSIYLLQWSITPLFITLVKTSGIIPIFPPVFFFQRLTYVLAYMLLLIGFSSATYYGIENPCRNFINRKYRGFERLKIETNSIKRLKKSEESVQS